MARRIGWLVVRIMPTIVPKGNAIIQAQIATAKVQPKPETIQSKYGSVIKIAQFQL